MVIVVFLFVLYFDQVKNEAFLTANETDVAVDFSFLSYVYAYVYVFFFLCCFICFLFSLLFQGRETVVTASIHDDAEVLVGEVVR